MNSPNETGHDPQLVLLGTFLQLEKEVRHAGSVKELDFIVGNESHRLFPYDRAAVWSCKSMGRFRVEVISGVAAVDRHAPFVRWLQDLIREYVGDAERSRQLQPLSPAQLSKGLQNGWKEWTAEHVLWCPLVHPQGELVGGLLFFRRHKWRDAELTLIERLLDAYAHARGALLRVRGRRSGRPWLRSLLITALLAAFAAAMFLPVRESALAPAEVIAQAPLLVSAPMDGVIQEIHVQPNQPVKNGEPLFRQEDTVYKNRRVIAQKTLEVARAELLSAEQKAFSDRSSKAELALLRAKIDEREAELSYVEALLERLQVRAERDGIAVFTDVNDWQGKPVKTGEKVMTLADPERTEVQLWVPVADAINLSAGATVRFFLNTDPTRPLAAQTYQAAYEAAPAPDGALAFRVKAKFAASTDPTPRIGLKGTGKIYGKEVKLYYYLFRRPWAAIRQWLGV
ncbi:MAG: HlyD family efflux transporter periplasmic adaptor subunit [Gammaproteobacteria bacterium]|nr:HlyD family efflux transporter periplasmic adaptor subunit [Gammaproteobacteria bacterium]